MYIYVYSICLNESAIKFSLLYYLIPNVVDNYCDQKFNIIISIHTIKADFNLFIICSYNDNNNIIGEEVKSCYMLQKHITYSLLNSRIFYIDTLCSEM
jgi:hypothetical protein